MNKIVAILALTILTAGCSSNPDKDDSEYQTQVAENQKTYMALQKLRLEKPTFKIDCPTGCTAEYNDPNASKMAAMPKVERATNGWDAVISVGSVVGKVALPVLIHKNTVDGMVEIGAGVSSVAVAAINKSQGTVTTNTVTAQGNAAFGDENAFDASNNSDNSTNDSSANDSSANDSSTNDSSTNDSSTNDSSTNDNSDNSDSSNNADSSNNSDNSVTDTI